MSRLTVLLKYGMPYKRFARVYFPTGVFFGWGLSIVVRRDAEANLIQYAYFVNLESKVNTL